MAKPRSFPVTDDLLDAPDGAIVDGYKRCGDRWFLLPEAKSPNPAPGELGDEQRGGGPRRDRRVQ